MSKRTRLTHRRIKRAWCRQRMPALSEMEILPANGSRFLIGWDPATGEGMTYQVITAEWGKTRWRIEFTPADDLDLLTILGH